MTDPVLCSWCGQRPAEVGFWCRSCARSRRDPLDVSPAGIQAPGRRAPLAAPPDPVLPRGSGVSAGHDIPLAVGRGAQKGHRPQC